ncbi:MAG: NAD(P)H-dependent oxidoreductase subunit E [Candidatus Brocadiia bacterium]
MPVVETEPAVQAAQEMLESYGRQRDSLIHVLQDLQERFDYLPRPALEQVAEGLGLPLPEVLRVATFYAAFSLEPLGEHVISVCTGTACHVRGARTLVETLEDILDVERGRTTQDGLFTLKTVNCLGACALGPLVAVDGNYYGHMTPARLEPVLEEYGFGRDDDQD